MDGLARRTDPSGRPAVQEVPPDHKDRIRIRIDRLSDDPRPTGCEKIAGADALFRVRAGEYRIVYAIQDDILVVIVVLIGNRRDVHDALRNL